MRWRQGDGRLDPFVLFDGAKRSGAALGVAAHSYAGKIEPVVHGRARVLAFLFQPVDQPGNGGAIAHAWIVTAHDGVTIRRQMAKRGGVLTGFDSRTIGHHDDWKRFGLGFRQPQPDRWRVIAKREMANRKRAGADK